MHIHLAIHESPLWGAIHGFCDLWPMSCVRNHDLRCFSLFGSACNSLDYMRSIPRKKTLDAMGKGGSSNLVVSTALTGLNMGKRGETCFSSCRFGGCRVNGRRNSSVAGTKDDHKMYKLLLYLEVSPDKG